MFGLSLTKAVFRGIQFDVEEVESTHENNLIVHEFINNEKPYIESNGVKAKTYPLTAFFSGKNHLYQRDILMAAFKDGKSGKLIHPTDGIINVYPKLISSKNVNGKINYTKIKVEFIESSDTNYPISAIDKVLDQLTKIDSFINNATLTFLDTFSVLHTSSYILKSAIGMVSKVSGFLESTNGLGIFKNSIDEIETLVRKPEELSGTILKSVASIPPSKKNVLGLSKVSEDFKILKSKKSDTKVIRTIQQNNNAISILLIIFTYTKVVKELIDILGNETKKSNDDTIISRTDIINIIHDIDSNIDSLIFNQSDKNYNSYYQFKNILQEVIHQSSHIPDISYLKLNEPEPSLLVCYRVNGSIDLENDLILRNDISDPCFIPESKEIEVLSA